MNYSILKKWYGTCKTVLVITVMALLSAFVFPQRSMAASGEIPEKKDIIMIGDRLVDVAFNLGVVPSAMSVRCSLWPMCDKLQSAVQVLGCPSCLVRKKAKPMLDYIEKHGTRLVLIEKSDQFCTYTPDVKLEEVGSFVAGKDIEIIYIDFTKGLNSAVKQTSALLGYPDRAGKVIDDYKSSMRKAENKIQGKKHTEKVVILKGTYQAETGKSFIQVEVPGGYADRFILGRLGIENIGDRIISGNKKSSKGHITIRKLDRLVEAAPDAIIMTGDIASVQRILAKAVENNKSLSDVPAIRDMKLFGLPAYIDASVIEYPMILMKWADVLSE